ncbi:alpha/beta fold hydrolase [Streptomyces xanthii]|uniref:Alpha/beta fold hydrolase n=1 Tax=Streptomyces xanthii TaxID=2768069 RepID=A0A7H1B6I4_9ACTN|nr:alpha/beta hydrolase [Streptomyces xanthii]QNS04339.1 alpha/beta fold hydrolase [Streptomyces xanthii]
MTEPTLVLTQLAGDDDAAHLLVVGPSLGTGVAGLWSDCAALLPPNWQVVGWDLPGHGASPAATHAFTVDDLATAVRTRSAELAAGRRAAYAGVSLGGAVGFTLALDPGPFDTIVTLASAPRIGTPEGWRERAALVRRAGTAALVEGSATRWFAPGFLARDPATGSGLLHALQHVDDTSYALACEALAGYDVRDRLTSAKVPPLVAGGAHDTVVTPDQVDIVLAGVAHLPPAEDPAATAHLLTTRPTREQR